MQRFEMESYALMDIQHAGDSPSVQCFYGLDQKHPNCDGFRLVAPRYEPVRTWPTEYDARLYVTGVLLGNPRWKIVKISSSFVQL